LLEVQDGRKLALRPSSGKQGTVVEVRDLFFSLPGRKRFLKQPAAETSMCRNVLTEKAIAHPGVGFRLFTDGSLRLSLPPASKKERILAAAEGKIEASLVDEISGSGPSFTVEALLARPEARRKDRKFLQVFVNGRRLWDYALLQAIEYGYGGYVPGGLHPVAFVFLQVDPALVDFNIHPAKKEARFRNMGELHHRIVTLVQSHLRSASLQRMVSDRRTPAAELPGFRDAPAKSPSDRWRSPLNVDRHASVASPAPSDSARRAWLPPESGGPSRPQTHSFRGPVEQTGETATPYGGAGDSELTYFGQLFGVFLLASFRGEFFIVDQHAAHERLIYDKLRSRPGVQELLVPLEFELDEDAAAFARSKRESFEHLGISIEEHNAEENAETGSFRITRIPEAFLGAEGSLISAIASLSATEQGLEEELYARTACRSAVMDGDRVDELTAMHILRGTFALDNPRCPHGRPVFHKLTRPELFKLVERT
jgi:DNA mismatch repair protein MutL